jgi:DNA-binding XRE family transcriptional regulator
MNIIAKHRKKHNMSQKALAREVGLSQQAISKYEREIVTPPVDIAKKIGKLFKFDWTEIYS